MVLERSIVACYHDGAGKGEMYREVEGGIECVGAGSQGDVAFRERGCGMHTCKHFRQLLRVAVYLWSKLEFNELGSST
jgi:hypothetical protein